MVGFIMLFLQLIGQAGEKGEMTLMCRAREVQLTRVVGHGSLIGVAFLLEAHVSKLQNGGHHLQHAYTNRKRAETQQVDGNVSYIAATKLRNK